MLNNEQDSIRFDHATAAVQQDEQTPSGV